MRNALGLGGLKPKSHALGALITTQAAWFRCHEGSGATLVDSLGVVADQTLLGTTTASRTKGGCITGNADGTAANNNRVKIVDAALNLIMDPATATDSILVVNAHLTIGQTVAGTEYLWSVGIPVGPIGTPGGGFGMLITTNRYPQIAWRQRGTATTTTYQGPVISSPASYPVSRAYLCAFDFRDPAAPLASLYVNGVISGISSSALATDGAGGLLPLLHAQGIWVGGRPNQANPHTGDPQACFGTQTAGKSSLANVLFARIPAANAALIPVLAREMANNPHDYPLSLVQALS